MMDEKAFLTVNLRDIANGRLDERGPVTWLITAWPANRKERERYAKR